MSLSCITCSGSNMVFEVFFSFYWPLVLNSFVEEVAKWEWVSWGGLGICIGCPLDAFLGRCSWHAPPGGDPKKDTEHTGVTMSLGWPGNTLGSSRKSWRKCAGRGKSGRPCSDSWPRNPAQDKRKKMDGWMESEKNKTFQDFLIFFSFRRLFSSVKVGEKKVHLFYCLL